MTTPKEQVAQLENRIRVVSTDQSDLYHRTLARRREHIETLRKKRQNEIDLYDAAIAHEESLIALMENNRQGGESLLESLRKQLRIAESLVAIQKVAADTVKIVGRSQVIKDLQCSYKDLESEIPLGVAVQIVNKYCL